MREVSPGGVCGLVRPVPLRFVTSLVRGSRAGREGTMTLLTFEIASVLVVAFLAGLVVALAVPGRR